MSEIDFEEDNRNEPPDEASPLYYMGFCRVLEDLRAEDSTDEEDNYSQSPAGHDLCLKYRKITDWLNKYKSIFPENEELSVTDILSRHNNEHIYLKEKIDELRRLTPYIGPEGNRVATLYGYTNSSPILPEYIENLERLKKDLEEIEEAPSQGNPKRQRTRASVGTRDGGSSRKRRNRTTKKKKMTKMIIKQSTNPNKKLMAVFTQNGKKKITHFGANGMDDYTITKDKNQRKNYRIRHRRDLNTGDYKRAGYLSYYILWGDSTSRRENIKAYKKRFNLH